MHSGPLRGPPRVAGEPAPPLTLSGDDPLYQAALAVEQDARLAAEMAEWEAATVCDGLHGAPIRKRDR
jgi:hypothetical protein